MNKIYLDNSATTPISSAVSNRMKFIIDSVYGNPSSMHALGLEAEHIVNEARENILSSLGVRDMSSKTVIFTGSGTEADNLALAGVCSAKERPQNKRIVITDSEHSAISETAIALEKRGIEVVRLSTRNGVIDPDEVRNSVTKNTVLISVMLVNNETGAVYDIASAFRIAKSINPDIVTHTDAVQGYLKIPFNMQRSGSDMVTLSAHKVHGPKGVGALVIDNSIVKTKKLVPIIYGGGQERGYRSGTENVIGIAGFGETSKCRMDADRVKKIKDHLIEGLDGLVRINMPKGEAAPHILNLTVDGIKSETMLHFLSSKGIYVSSGSACSSHNTHVSPTLIAFGLSEREADSSLRISLDDCITEGDADACIEAFKEGISKLQKTK